jgi:Ca2+-binding RTX toxin-like protein
MVTINVGAGADTFDFSGNVANTTKQATGAVSNLVGGSGNDTIVGNTNIGGTLSGGNGNDTIAGGNGNDIIVGGAGNDRLIGRAGDDTFVFRPGFGHDTISDFQVGDELHHDTLDLRGLGFASIDDVLAATSDTPNAVIHAGADDITLTFVTKASLSLHTFDILI